MRGKLFTSSKGSSPTNSYSQSPARSSVSTPSHHRTFSSSIMEEDLLYAEQMIKRWDLDSPLYTKIDYLFTGDRREARQYMKAVKNLQSAMHCFVSESGSSDKIVHAQKLMQVAMKRLEKEFYRILSLNRDVLDSESVSVSVSNSRARSSVSDEDDDVSEDDDRISSSGNTVSDGDRVSDLSVSELAMADLKSIADCMISSGYALECVKIYKIIRKSIVDETLYNLEVEKYSFNQINKMDWETIEPKIKSWLYATKVAIKSLFYGERILCDYVFSSSEKIRESCFSDICKERAMVLFEFPELVAKSKKSLERMFKTLDLYNAISENWAEIEMIFAYESMAAVRTQAVASLVKLGDAVRAMLADFEAAIQKEISKTPFHGGGVHPLTRYVMNYLVFLSDYTFALSDIVADYPQPNQSALPESYLSTSEDLPPISARFAWIILVLLCKIDASAELYRDVAQSYLFLVNNLNYVVSKVNGSNLRSVIGDDWTVKHERKVKEYAGKYERMAWSKVISSLPANPTADNLTVETAKDCFRRFNVEFGEAYRKQSTWIISDSKIRDEIKISVAKKITPVYRSLYERYRGVFRGVDSVVRYAPDDLGNYLSDLFHGAGAPGSTNTSSSHSSLSSSLGGR